MSETRTNRPNNTAGKIEPRMIHVSKRYVPINDPKTGLLLRWQPLKGETLDLGHNAQKRVSRRASIKRRLAARAA